MLDKLFMPVRGEMTLMEDVLLRESECGVEIAGAVTKHVIRSGGKRIRPAIFLLSAKAAFRISGRADKSASLTEVAAALEMIHTASLLHDDVVDEDGTRRGRASANAAFGNSASILVGDLLWCAASRMIVSAGMPRLTDAVVDAVRATAIGALLEIECAKDAKIDRDKWLGVLNGKTAELFSLCACSAAILAQANSSLEETLAKYGRSVGMAFQLTDDAIDSRDDKRCAWAFRGIELLGGADAAIELARRYAAEAMEQISVLPSSIERDSLMGLADYAANRDS